MALLLALRLAHVGVHLEAGLAATDEPDVHEDEEEERDGDADRHEQLEGDGAAQHRRVLNTETCRPRRHHHHNSNNGVYCTTIPCTVVYKKIKTMKLMPIKILYVFNILVLFRGLNYFRNK